MVSAEHRPNMAAMRDMTGMAILNFFSANSKFFHSDVKNAEHLGAEDRTKESEGERNVSSSSSSMRLGSTLSISSYLSSSFPSLLSFSLPLLPQGCRSVTQGFVAIGIAPCFQLHQNENFHFILPNAGESRGRKVDGEGISFICIIFLCHRFQRMEISVAADKQNAFSAEYLVWLLECKKGLNIFIHDVHEQSACIFLHMHDSMEVLPSGC